MAITYGNASSAKLILDAHSRGHAAGFRVAHILQGKETLYRVLPGGQVQSRMQRNAAPNFNPDKRQAPWLSATHVPGEAEWIGGYEIEEKA